MSVVHISLSLMSKQHPLRLVAVGISTDLLSKLADRSNLLNVTPVAVGENMLSAIADARPELIVLCKGLGAQSAVQLCRALKQKPGRSSVPVVLLGHGDDSSIENAAFAAGADDYVARIGTTSAIISRLRAIRRRYTNQQHDQDFPATTLKVGHIEVPSESYMARVSGRRIALTVSEFHILWLLAKNPNRTFTASELTPGTLEPSAGSPARSVRSHICSLRRKLGRHASMQLQTVRNAGYRLTTG